MWFENITKDFGDFTNSIMEDTRGLANMVSRLAAEMTGHGVCIAGDEDSFFAQKCPLDESAILALQGNDAVYLEEPRGLEEKALFEEWARRSAYSSANAPCSGHLDPTGGGGSDEAAVTSRQRLLDENPLVAEKYAALVQAKEPPRQKGLTDAKTAPGPSAREGEAKEEKGRDAKESGTPTKPPEAPLPGSQRITEDAFFDHYFFRLSQLRLSTAAERQKREAAASAAAAKEEEEAAARAARETEPPREEQAKKKSLAERFMEVTDELVGWNAEEPVDAQGSSAGEVSGSRGNGGGVARTEADWREQEDRLTALESLVNILQKELNEERRKLAAVLSVVEQCGLSEDQRHQLQAAMAMVASRAVEATPPPAVSLSSSLPLKPVETASKDDDCTSRGDGAGVGRSEGDGATQDPSLPVAVPRTGESRMDPAPAPSTSSSVDNDSWTNV
ncbi:hypothetical protein TraAM80_00732 [Trypanosoma rangeli]|uniref:Uncharacterized protein n=1 Tax=Trypanosoma rangeli TaxID=5698 RepID=A0A3R7NU60_TRYRA|nr:uncharacterized protein TraAM80_00732 [Trypanosoma rangeli]RNF11749.1 hypothetical protein TraAM80_00732 [Trypanosoma rangeli]|eukprot:RNF11749.1 hypothetical protein TraAM80_00732 [Trypanosoma rangeli]